MAYITKDGKWLAYRDATQEILEYDDFSDVQQVYQPEWFWVDNKDDAKVFHAESIIIFQYFLCCISIGKPLVIFCDVYH